VFQEVDEDVFANNAISEALIGNDYLRSYILLL
jgi:hypothetical protein